MGIKVTSSTGSAKSSPGTGSSDLKQPPAKIVSGKNRRIVLQEGQCLSVVGGAGGAGTVVWIDESLGGSASLQSWTVGVGAIAAIGPYAGVQRFLITCTAGSIDATVAEAIVNVPQLVVGTADANNSDGRPDNTWYAKVSS